MVTLSTQVQTQIDNAKAVIAAGKEHGERISKAGAQQIRNGNAGEIEGSLTLLVTHLADKTAELEAAERRYVAEQADDVPLRDARDAAAVALIALVLFVRARLEQAFGPRVLLRYAMDGETPRVPGALAAYVQTALRLMRDHPQTMTDPAGAEVSTLVLADTLERGLQPLQTQLDALVRENRENEAALTARDRVTEEWRRAYRAVAMGLAAYFILAGRDDLADRLRPTVRREAGFDPIPPLPEGGPANPNPSA